MVSKIIGKLIAFFMLCSFYMLIESISKRKKKAAVIWGLCFTLPIIAVIALIITIAIK